jgi:hypothetical protein
MWTIWFNFISIVQHTLYFVPKEQIIVSNERLWFELGA